jgi:hypothetical protein
MYESEDDLLDDYYAQLYSGDICYRCGQSIEYCICDKDNITNLKGDSNEC